MNKTTIRVLFIVVILAGVVVAQGNSQRFLVKSDNAALKAMFGVQHNFKQGFTTELTKGQLKALEMLGIETEEVPLYQMLGKPGCECDNDGICEPENKEHPSCCADCKGGGEEEPGRTCYPSQQKPWGIEMVNGGSGGAGVDVAVLDTGVYTDHLDLKDNIVDCKDFTKGPKAKNNCKDDDGHGTHVAGTIAANGGSDGKGIFGVAPQAGIMALKVCGGSGCWSDDIATAIEYAGSQGAEIVSMSLGGDSPSSLIKDAIGNNPDILYVAAAGNDGPAYGSIDYPGAYAEVIAVGAIYYQNYTETFNWKTCIDVSPEENDVACWSSRGIYNESPTIEEREVEFATPGVFVESTYNDGCYYVESGTSMATPHVAGLSAKLWQGNAADTRSYLQSIAKDIWTAGDDTATGFGLPIAP